MYIFTFGALRQLNSDSFEIEKKIRFIKINVVCLQH